MMMGSTLGQLRTALRVELGDEDPTNRRWGDAALDQYLRQALRLVEEARPAFAWLRKTVPSPATRRIDVSADVPPTFLWLDAVEYPVDRAPQRFRPFREEAGPLVYLLIDEPPPAGDVVAVWYAHGYAVAEASSDLPSELERTVLDGGLALALRGRAIGTTDRLVPPETPAGYGRLGERAWERFERGLRTLQARRGRPRWGVTWDAGRPCTP
jgi:hypothetical protein